MNEMNGFHVNTEIKETGVKTKRQMPKWKKILRSPLIMGSAAIVIIAAIILTFLSVVPLKSVKLIESCTATDTDGNKEISYYNKDGNIEKVELLNADVKYGEKLYTYNKNGDIEKIENYYVDELFETENYIYTDGVLSETQLVGADGVLHSKSVYTYVDGLLELKTDYDGENNAVNETKYVYDNKVCIQQINVTVSNGYTVTTDYTYEGGKVTNENRSTSKGATSAARYTYDRYGNVLSKTEDSDDYTLYAYTFKTKKVPVLS